MMFWIGCLIGAALWLLFANYKKNGSRFNLKNIDGVVILVILAIVAFMGFKQFGGNSMYIDTNKIATPRDAVWSATLTKDELNEYAKSQSEIKVDKELKQDMQYTHVISSVFNEYVDIGTYIANHEYEISNSDADIILGYVKRANQELERCADEIQKRYKHQPLELHSYNIVKAGKALEESVKMIKNGDNLYDVDDEFAIFTSKLSSQALQYFNSGSAFADVLQSHSK